MSLPIYIVNWDELVVPKLPNGSAHYSTQTPQLLTYETACQFWDETRTIAHIIIDRPTIIQNVFLWVSAYKMPDSFSVFLNNVQIFNSILIKSQTQEHLFENNWKLETNDELFFVYQNKSLTSKQIKLQIETG